MSRYRRSQRLMASSSALRISILPAMNILDLTAFGDIDVLNPFSHNSIAHSSPLSVAERFIPTGFLSARTNRYVNRTFFAKLKCGPRFIDEGGTVSGTRKLPNYRHCVPSFQSG